MGARTFDHIFDFTVQEKHVDVYGHVNNATYLQLFEQARWDRIGKRGGKLEWIAQFGQGPIVLEVNVKFLRELKPGEKIRIGTLVEGKPARLYSYTQLMLRGDEVVCEAKYRMGFLNMKTRKLVEPNEDWSRVIFYEAKNSKS